MSIPIKRKKYTPPEILAFSGEALLDCIGANDRDNWHCRKFISRLSPTTINVPQTQIKSNRKKVKNMGLLTVHEVAKRLNLSEYTTYTWFRAGKLKGLRLEGRFWRMEEGDLEEYLKKSEAKA
jgi:excisionase family DNA binding protein